MEPKHGKGVVHWVKKYISTKDGIISFPRPKNDSILKFEMEIFIGDYFIITPLNDLKYNIKGAESEIYHYSSEEIIYILEFFDEGTEIGYFTKEN